MIRKLTVIAFSSLVTFFAYAGNTYAYDVANERQTYTAWSSTRGSTVNIPERTIADLCGDWDGCTLRMGMYNWDGTRRTASRSSLFYYNRGNKNWVTVYPPCQKRINIPGTQPFVCETITPQEPSADTENPCMAGELGICNSANTT
jgi:hypothetical protein